MSRPLWKGYMSFGLVMIPITLHSGETGEHEMHFTLLDERDHHRVRYQRINEASGKEVPWKSIVKGYEVSEGNYITITPEDFKKAAPKAARVVELTDFVPREQIRARYFEKPYYLQPGEHGEKAYAVLRDTLIASARVGIAKVVITTRQYLAAVMAEDNVLILNTLRFAHEVRDPGDTVSAPPKSVKSTAQEIQMARALIEGMSSDWKPSQYHDDYFETLDKYIKARAKGRAPKLEDQEEEPPESYNMMELLKKSVEGVRKQKPQRAAHRPAALAKRKAG